MIRSSRFFWLLVIAGALLLVKGSFAVYPSLFPNPTAQLSLSSDLTSSVRFEPGAALFELSLPAHSAALTVVEGTTAAALRKGPGHLEGTPLPGEHGNVVIAGHRDTHFRVLKDVLIGDEIRVESARRDYTYRITDIRIVSPKDTHVLRPQSRAALTLITCYPFRYLGPAPERYVVQALLVEP